MKSTAIGAAAKPGSLTPLNENARADTCLSFLVKNYCRSLDKPPDLVYTVAVWYAWDGQQVKGGYRRLAPPALVRLTTRR
jgi:hypothetical protein